jgi:hypothetical protein
MNATTGTAAITAAMAALLVIRLVARVKGTFTS